MSDKHVPWEGTKRQCTATSKATGQRCRRAAIRGALVCQVHGGAAPSTKRAAARRITEADLHAEVARLQAAGEWESAAPITDPLTALQTLAGTIEAWRRFLSEKVAELNGALVYETAATDGVGALALEERAKVLVELFERAQDRCVKTLAVLARAGVDDRLAAISEAQAQLVIGAVLAGITDVQLAPEQAEPLRDAIANRLEAIEA